MALTGFSVSYFDLFNMPMLTVGFPVIMWMSISTDTEKNKLINSIKLYFHWFLGFALTTFTKMVLSELLFSRSSSSTAFRWYTGITGEFTLISIIPLEREKAFATIPCDEFLM